MKKILLSLGLLFVGIISFCSAEDIVLTLNDSISGGYNDGINNNTYYLGNTLNSNIYGLNLIMSSGDIAMCQIYYTKTSGTEITTNLYIYSNSAFDSFTWCQNKSSCAFVRGVHVKYIYANDGSQYGKHGYLSGYVYTNGQSSGGGSCPACPEVDTGAILSGYIPESQLISCQSDLSSCQSSLSGVQSQLNSCQSNTSGFNDQLNNCNLSLNACNSSLTNCLQYNCPEIDYTGDLLRSNIYINNILHPGRQFVNIEIPDYIQWDYSVGDDDFNLYVGSGYDVDYIESVIDINSYRPTSEDFTNVFVSGLTLVMPYIVIALFIIFVRKLLKRIFK